MPTEAEWTVFRKYARRMRKLIVDAEEDPVVVLFKPSKPSLYTANGPLFPKLESFKCENTSNAVIPFIPSFLSHKTTKIDIQFDEGLPASTVASMIARLPKLCPGLTYITFGPLPRDPVITKAVSELLLSCNQDSLRCFRVDSPLTEVAREVVFQLPKLSALWVVIQGHAQIPPVALPNIIMIDIQYDDHLDWLQGFRGAMLGGLEDFYFHSESEQIGDFLGEFTSMALTTSASATFSAFRFDTSQSWDPNYRSLLPFTQLKDLQIGFSCDDHCSSRVDDAIIEDLVQAMPKLEILKLGDAPCRARRGATVKGLVTLARGCRHLSTLCIHFQAASLGRVATGPSAPSDDETVVRQQDCALTDLEVGEIPISRDSVLEISMVLLQIFPRLLNIEYENERWQAVADNIELFQKIGTFVEHTGKVHLLYP